MPLGNIFETSLEDILNGERAKNMYDGFSRRCAVEELCKRCGYAKRHKNKITEFISWFQTVDKLDEKSVCLQLFYLKSAVDFRNPLPFRRLSAKPPQRKRLWGLG
ncbi:SPASM domain-containing protein [[Brevibacterium] frigoritolerans]|uniref:SPASM domain-containing protein n=1 Tax=Peribacillus frigoritolerans TaxID=450367 RepID=A0A941JAY5_9BACI|nr:SPASM domain-containing protein [Peribacillus frigoritolerans]